MSEISNSFYDAIDEKSDAQQSITESEWDKIRQDKDKILSGISDDKMKDRFENRYNFIDKTFQREGEQILSDTSMHYTSLKNIIFSDQIANEKERQVELDSALDFFGNNSDLKEIQNVLESEVGLDLTNVLSSYKDFIANTLKLPEGSNISEGDYKKLISNIKQCIINQLLEVKNTVLELKEDNNGVLKNMQWDINTALKDQLSSITDSLFPSAIFYLNMSKNDISNHMLDKEKVGDKTKLYTGMRLREIHEGFIDEKIKNGDDLPTGLINNDSFWTADKLNYQKRDNFLIKNNKIIGEGKTIESQTEGLKEITFLNEKDKQIEDEAMIAMLCLVGACCIPYAGAIPSALIDAQDICSSEDQTIKYLKNMGVVDQNFHMSKAWYDHMLAAVGVLGSLIGLQAAAKSVKLAKILRKIKSSSLSGDKIASIMGTVTDKLGLSSKDKGNLTGDLVDNQPKKGSLFEKSRKKHEAKEVNLENELKYVEEYQKAIDNLPPVKEGYMRLYRGVKQIGTELEFVKKSDAQSKLYSKVLREGYETLTNQEKNDYENMLPLLNKGEARYFSTDWQTAGGYGFDRKKQEVGDIFYMDVPYEVSIDNLTETGGLQSRLGETGPNYVGDAIALHVDDLHKYDAKKIEKSTTVDIKILENLNGYNHPKTDAEVVNKLMSGDNVRLYHSHSTQKGTAESMMDNGIIGSRGNEAFFSTMPPLEGEIINSTLYVDVSGKKFFDMRGKDVTDIPGPQVLLDQGYDGSIGVSTSSLANSNLEVILFEGEKLGGVLNKFQESAAIPRIHQQLEDIFKLNRLYGPNMDFSLAQQNIIFGNIRELINSGKELNTKNLGKLSEELKAVDIPEDKVKKIIRILEKQEGRLEISTEQVYKNAGLNNKDRIAAAIDLLNTNNISPAQKDALFKAHEIGGYDSGVFRYTKDERTEKVRILIKEGEFSSTQTQDLLDSGLAGKISEGELKLSSVYKKNTEVFERINVLDKQYPEKYNGGDETILYRYANNKSGINESSLEHSVNDNTNGVGSFWHVDRPHDEYTSKILIKTTVGDLKKEGIDIRIDAEAVSSGENSISLVGIANRNLTNLPGERQVISGYGLDGKTAIVINNKNEAVYLDGKGVEGRWTGTNGNVYFGDEDIPINDIGELKGIDDIDKPDYGILDTKTNKIISNEVRDLGLNNLETQLLKSLNIDPNKLLHIDSIPNLEVGINNISNQLEGKLLLQLLDKLPKKFTDEYLKGYEVRIANKLETVKSGLGEVTKIIDGEFPDDFLKTISEYKSHVLSQEYVSIDKRFLTQILGINMADCDKIIDAVTMEKTKGTTDTLKGLMTRLEKVKALFNKNETKIISIDDISIIKNRFIGDKKDRINDVSIKLDRVITNTQKTVIGDLHELIDDLYDQALDYISLDDLDITGIKKMLSSIEIKEERLLNVGFKPEEITLLIDNAII